MTEVFVDLPNAEQIQRFVAVVSGLDGDFDLFDGNRILDARSLMGIFSFDLAKPIKLRIYHDSNENLEAIRAFIAGTENER
ncbi:MAG TPA: HPr family phosphocarrier protein [Pseudoflavonifractor sp.]|nr:HPr family phosphocarrier protein [Pseudoflavonifractor sp.]